MTFNRSCYVHKGRLFKTLILSSHHPHTTTIFTFLLLENILIWMYHADRLAIISLFNWQNNASTCDCFADLSFSIQTKYEFFSSYIYTHIFNVSRTRATTREVFRRYSHFFFNTHSKLNFFFLSIFNIKSFTSTFFLHLALSPRSSCEWERKI